LCIQKKKHCDRQQYQFLGLLHFGQRTNKVVHFFRKLEDEKTIKTREKKKLDASALAQKQPHRKLGVGGEAMMSFLGRRPRPRPSGFSAARRCWWSRWVFFFFLKRRRAPSAAPSLRLRPIHLPLDRATSVKVVKVGSVEGTGPTALTKASSVRRLCSLVIVVVS